MRASEEWNGENKWRDNENLIQRDFLGIFFASLFFVQKNLKILPEKIIFKSTSVIFIPFASHLINKKQIEARQTTGKFHGTN